MWGQPFWPIYCNVKEQMALIIKARFAEMLYTVKPTTEVSTLERDFFDVEYSPSENRKGVGWFSVMNKIHNSPFRLGQDIVVCLACVVNGAFLVIRLVATNGQLHISDNIFRPYLQFFFFQLCCLLYIFNADGC